ncbi:GNAT family N-acetyltransferase [Alcaligenaceae bacterium]|nr:GNAT family N-acetyltransferase [Alcaligenaceae bacterium]
MSFTLQAMQVSDLDQVLALQASAYPDILHEDAAFYQSRLDSSPDSVWVACKDTTVVGYLVSYPWDGKALPVLNSAPPAPAPAPTEQMQDQFWFLHDCAVSLDARGLGVGQGLLQHGLAHARQVGFQMASLVSLPGAINYWQAQGYRRDAAANDGWRADLLPYGEGAAYMARSLVTT